LPIGDEFLNTCPSIHVRIRGLYMFYKTHTHTHTHIKWELKKYQCCTLSEGETKIKTIGKVAVECKAIYIILT
jgi:hypothetical protein